MVSVIGSFDQDKYYRVEQVISVKRIQRQVTGKSIFTAWFTDYLSSNLDSNKNKAVMPCV